jgi:dTDP-4-amino-4,6-dideoxygalactose transaminase
MRADREDRMKIPLLDLTAQYETIRSQIDAAMATVVRSQRFILGPSVVECEAAVARYCECPFGVGVSSGTDALLSCLMAESIGPGDEVITTPYTFFATAGAIARVGARPVFVDIRADSYNIDAGAIEQRIGERTRAIIPVHLFGQMCEMGPIMDLAARHGLVVIEDAAQAIGAVDAGRRAGSIGHYGCFSFFPSKNLGAFGDGGMVTATDQARAERVRLLRGHGAEPKYYHSVVGGNFRLDALQAVVVTAKLQHLDRWTAARQRNAARYDELLRASGLVARGLVGAPAVVAERHVFNQYVIRVQDRDALRESLSAAGVGTEIYYPVPLHLQECFRSLGHGVGAFPQSEQAARETLALPVYPELSDEQQRYVVDAIAAFFRHRP